MKGTIEGRTLRRNERWKEGAKEKIRKDGTNDARREGDTCIKEITCRKEGRIRIHVHQD